MAVTTFPHNRIVWQFSFNLRHEQHGGVVLLKSLENSLINLFLRSNWSSNEFGYNAQLTLTYGSKEIFQVNGNYTTQERLQCRSWKLLLP